jgi:hypothetical protein
MLKKILTLIATGAMLAATIDNGTRAIQEPNIANITFTVLCAFVFAAGVALCVVAVRTPKT